MSDEDEGWKYLHEICRLLRDRLFDCRAGHPVWKFQGTVNCFAEDNRGEGRSLAANGK